MMSKIKTNDRVFYTLVLFMGFLSSFFVCLFLKNNFLFQKSISIQIDPINIISIIVNVLLIIYATRFLNRRNEEDRVEKDVLIVYLKDFQSNLDGILKDLLLTEKALDFGIVVAKLKMLRQSFNTVAALIKKYGYSDLGACVKIDSYIRDINDSFTNTVKSEGGAVTIDMDKISVDMKIHQDIEESNSRIRQVVFDLIVVINRKS